MVYAALDLDGRHSLTKSPDYLAERKTLTLADIAVVAYTRVAEEGGFELSELFENVRAWISRVENDLGPFQERTPDVPL